MKIIEFLFSMLAIAGTFMLASGLNGWGILIISSGLAIYWGLRLKHWWFLIMNVFFFMINIYGFLNNTVY